MTYPLPPQPDQPTAQIPAMPVVAPPAPKRRLGLVLAVAAGLVVAAGIGAAGTVALLHGPTAPKPAGTTTSATEPPIQVNGNLELLDSTAVLNLDNVHCKGMNGYDDIQPGAQVVITDQSGTVVGTGSLGDGVMLGSGFSRTCTFGFSVIDVPAGHKFYGVSVSHRGSIQMTESELVQGPGLTLGH